MNEEYHPIQNFVEQLNAFWNFNILDNAINNLNFKDEKSSKHKILDCWHDNSKYYEKLKGEIESEITSTNFIFSQKDNQSNLFYFTHKKHSELNFCYFVDYWEKYFDFKISPFTNYFYDCDYHWEKVPKYGFILGLDKTTSFAKDIFLIKLFLHFDYTQLLEQVEKAKKGEQVQNIKYDFSSLTIQIEEEKRRQIVNAKLKEISTNAISAFFASLCKNKNIAYNIEFKNFKFHVLIKLPKKLMLDFSVFYEDFSKSRDEIKNLIEESLNLVQKNKIKPIIKTYGNNIKWQCETEENDVSKN